MSLRTFVTSKRFVAAAAIPAAVLTSGLMVWSSSYSAFSATTTNPTSNWAAGNVVLSDDDAGTAMFNASNLKPGQSAAKCIVVSSTGSLASTVKLYGTDYAQTRGLGDNLALKIEEGTGGSFNSCTGFAAASTAFDGTATAFSTRSSFATGVGTWAPAGASPASPVTRTFRVTYTLAAGTPDSAQGGTAALGLTWEAQNS